jgi:hypothetical protein
MLVQIIGVLFFLGLITLCIALVRSSSKQKRCGRDRAICDEPIRLKLAGRTTPKRQSGRLRTRPTGEALPERRRQFSN